MVCPQIILDVLVVIVQRLYDIQEMIGADGDGYLSVWLKSKADRTSIIAEGVGPMQQR